MTEEQVARLQPGDEVYWNDPDEGRQSRPFVIREISLLDWYIHDSRVVTIVDQDGTYLEALVEELS